MTNEDMTPFTFLYSHSCRLLQSICRSALSFWCSWRGSYWGYMRRDYLDYWKKNMFIYWKEKT